MMDRDPFDLPLAKHLWVLGIAVFGGFVSWYAKVRAGSLRGHTLMHLVGELATSAFAGLLMFWVCFWMGSPAALTAALVGIAGHMGARAIAWAEARLEQHADRFLPKGSDDARRS